MGATTTTARTDRWLPALFTLGAALLGGHVALLAVELLTTFTPPPDVLAPTGTLLVLLGVLGLARRQAATSPRLALAAGACATLAAASFAGLATGNLAAIMGLSTPPWLSVLAGPALAGTMLAFLAVGLAARGTTGPPAAAILLVPVGLYLGLVASVALLGAPVLGGIVVGTGQALTVLAIGHGLRPDTAPVPATTGDVLAG